MIIASLILALQTAAAPEASPAPPPPACESELHGAFDLWVGEWEVYPTGRDTKVADSRIERIASGCVIRETWMPLSGGGGTSMSMLNHRSGRWEQLWVGSDGKRVDFAGGPVGDTMVLTGYWDGIGPSGEDVLTRMTYSLESDGSVRQFGEGSTDHGKTWQTSFDLTYSRKAAP
ncbi:hypothetical protein [Erythrobacter rubeus]|uniref:DUF1579 domain-containing protein n=1 Tax=Erythrobacter rubeus TaxID=2760803 RepID=A0ABR8KTS2_9SPHN|nr:hypothetical protein [Erythrobacter rubeus]MBD2841647.1 hypothetical protein [Erythrobacter rubeus]